MCVSSRLQGKAVCHLDGAGEVACLKDRLHGSSGIPHGGKSRRESDVCRREWKELEGCLGNNAQQSLGSDEHPHEIKSGLVLVRASSDANKGSVSQCHLEAENIRAGDAVFETAGASGVGGNVAAE